MNSKPKVSIITITYNHEKYIAQALESFVAQKTNFEFEVIVADDCSKDKTQEIIKDYASAYPHIIKPVLREKNLGMNANFWDAASRATGEYMIDCEGDDFFTDENKLQIQADYMDQNEDCALSFHPVLVFFEDRSKKDEVKKPKGKRDLANLLKHNYMQTNTVMYRKQEDYSRMPQNIMPGDWYMHLFHAQFGKIGYIDRVMSAYRRHDTGVWWNSGANSDEIYKKHGVNQFNMFMEVFEIYKNNVKYKNIVLGHINTHLKRLIRIDEQYGTDLLKRAFTIEDEKRAAVLGDVMFKQILLDKKKYGLRHKLMNCVAVVLGLGKIYRKVK